MSLTTAKLTQARNRLTATLPDRCSINTITSTPGDMGGSGAETDTPVLTNVPCRLVPISQREREAGGQIVAEATHWLHLPAGTAITAAQSVTLGSRRFMVATPPPIPSEELLRDVQVTEVG